MAGHQRGTPRRPDRRTTALRGAVAVGGLLAAIGALWALGDMLLPAMNARSQLRTWEDVVVQAAWYGLAGAT